MRGNNKRWFVGGITVLLVALAACSPTTAVTPTAPAVAQGGKLLATVFFTPTPNAAEQQATRLAASPTPAIVTTLTPSPTVYVGVFLGSSAANEPFIDSSIGYADITPTRPPRRCALAPDPVVGDRWQNEPLVVNGLGCPIEGLIPFTGTRQNFQEGVIYGHPSGMLWAIELGEPGNYWFVEVPPESPEVDVNAPPGLLVPSGSFGAFWRSQPDIQQGLGFARLSVGEAALGYQRFEGGTLFLEADTGQVFALMPDGAAYGPY